ncbi:MAG: hypothetical protein A2171_02195 [Candidatus Levybacteria bacterium RBG_13_35_9]|nr:MAG: hypothetical protein A2171_02195 [Candidatus Levybacteria bacterium RBG_13_35_9]
MLYYAAILNGLCAPILLILILKISNNKNIMGIRTNSLISNIMGWTIFVIMAVSAIYLLVTTFIKNG